MGIYNEKTGYAYFHTHNPLIHSKFNYLLAISAFKLAVNAGRILFKSPTRP